MIILNPSLWPFEFSPDWCLPTGNCLILNPRKSNPGFMPPLHFVQCVGDTGLGLTELQSNPLPPVSYYLFACLHYAKVLVEYHKIISVSD